MGGRRNHVAKFPFGEVAATGGEGDKRKFTSYERDATDLDYAVNRHYSSAQGRFTQVDPIGMASVDPMNPQSLNLYAYTANDPVNKIDPAGLNAAGPNSFCSAEYSYQQCGGDEQFWGGGGGEGGSFGDGWAQTYGRPDLQGAPPGVVKAVLEHEQRIQNTRDAAAARKALEGGDIDTAMGILVSNPNVGVEVGGQTYWGGWGAMFLQEYEKALYSQGALVADGGVISVPLIIGAIKLIALIAAVALVSTAMQESDASPRLTLYRGIASGHAFYGNAKKGEAKPFGGHNDPRRHARGDTNSIFTSWTTRWSVAKQFATNYGSSAGIILEKRFHRRQVFPNPGGYADEHEFLVIGLVTGAGVHYVP